MPGVAHSTPPTEEEMPFGAGRGCVLEPPTGFRMTQTAGHRRPAQRSRLTFRVHAGSALGHHMGETSTETVYPEDAWKLCPSADSHFAVIMLWLLSIWLVQSHLRSPWKEKNSKWKCPLNEKAQTMEPWSVSETQRCSNSFHCGVR